MSLPRCPECGLPFDPADERTYRIGPVRSRRLALALVAAALFLAALVLLVIAF